MTPINRSATLRTAVLLALGLASLAAVHAQTIRVRCDTWGATRSRASVDGANLAGGAYTAVLTSAAHQATAASQPAQQGVVQFDFDSKKSEIKDGATPIGKKFIVNDTATGTLVDASGTVVAQDTRMCKAH